MNGHPVHVFLEFMPTVPLMSSQIEARKSLSIQGPDFGRSAVESNSDDEEEDEEILGPTQFSGAELRSARPPHSEDEGRNSLELDINYKIILLYCQLCGWFRIRIKAINLCYEKNARSSNST